MKSPARIGVSSELRFLVEPKHAIDFANDGMPAVLCTPWLIWFLEHAARQTVLPLLEPWESTVGVEIDLRHLAPTPVGEAVVCLARVAQSEGRLISFLVEARDEHELIARGYHRLRVIQVDRFAKRVGERNRQAPSPPA